MKTNRTLLKIAGISYCLSGCLLLDFPIIGILVIIAGVFLYIESSQPSTHIYENRKLLYLIAILGIFNLFGSIIIFIITPSISKEEKKNKINAPPEVGISKDKKKIDLLLKLGVGMVFLSSFFLSTTSWQFVTNNIKVISLIILGIVFLLLSFITEKSLKLYKSSYLYWLLSMSLFTFSVVSILYFEILGSSITFFNSNKMLAYSIVCFITAILLTLTYLKYTKKSNLYLCYIAITISLYCLLTNLHFSLATNISLIALIVMLLNIVIHKKDTFYYFSKTISYILFILLVKYQSISMPELITSSIITLINLNYLTFLYKDDDEPILSVICSYILILGICHGIDFIMPLYNLIVALLLGLYTILIGSNYIKVKDSTKYFSYFIYSVLLIIISISAIFGTDINYLGSSIVVVLIFGLINIMIKFGLFNMVKWKNAYYTEVFILLLFVSAVLKSLASQFDFAYIFATSSIIFSIIHATVKDKLTHRIYGIFIPIILLIAIILCTRFMHIFAIIMIVPASLYYFVITYIKYKDNLLDKIKLIVSYVLLLSSITFPFAIHNILNLDIIIPVCLILFLSFFISFSLNDKLLKKATYLYITIPLSTIIRNYNYADIEAIIATNAIFLYLIVSIINLIIKNKQAKNILIISIVIILLLPLLSYTDVFISIYIGIVGLLMILLNINKDEYSKVFTAGIIITIINIIHSLKDIWLQLPAWLYLLVGGLLIIICSLLKEIRHKN